jgi:hypothetical protein
VINKQQRKGGNYKGKEKGDKRRSTGEERYLTTPKERKG